MPALFRRTLLLTCAALAACLFTLTGTARAEPPGSLRGLVRDSSGRLLSGARVRVKLGHLSAWTVTNSGGLYEFSDLPVAGGYVVRAMAPRHTPVEQASVIIEAGAKTRLDFALPPSRARRAGSILGIVRNPAGRPIAGARVEVLQGEADGRDTTDRRGRFRLSKLPPGSYTLSVTSSRLAGEVVQDVIVQPGRGTHLKVAGDEPDEAAPGALFGTVTDGEGHPLVGATVEVVQGPVSAQTVTGEHGRYVLADLAAGTYAVRASQAGYLGNTWDGVRLEAGRELRLDFALRRSQEAPRFGRIAGRVTNGEGHALSGVTLEVVTGPTRRHTVTNAEGHYTLADLLPGGYGVAASREGHVTRHADGRVTAGETLTLNFELPRVEAPRPGHLFGKVSDPQGNPIAEAVVEILEGPSTHTGREGFYELNGLEPGAYRLRARRSGYRTSETVTVTVHAGEATRRDFTLHPEDEPAHGRIVGRVRNPEGGAIAEARVRILAGPVARETHTNGEGRFVLAELPEGTYRLLVSRAGWLSQETELLVVSTGSTREITITLRPSPGRIAGVVRNDQEQRLSEVRVEIIHGPAVGRHAFTREGEYALNELPAGTYTLRFSRSGYQTLELSTVVVEPGRTTPRNVTLHAVVKRPVLR